jgi:hypothetical protein
MYWRRGCRRSMIVYTQGRSALPSLAAVKEDASKSIPLSCHGEEDAKRRSRSLSNRKRNQLVWQCCKEREEGEL